MAKKIYTAESQFVKSLIELGTKRSIANAEERLNNAKKAKEILNQLEEANLKFQIPIEIPSTPSQPTLPQRIPTKSPVSTGSVGEIKQRLEEEARRSQEGPTKPQRQIPTKKEAAPIQAPSLPSRGNEPELIKALQELTQKLHALTLKLSA
jgi:hypothetical protein